MAPPMYPGRRTEERVKKASNRVRFGWKGAMRTGGSGQKEGWHFLVGRISIKGLGAKCERTEREAGRRVRKQKRRTARHRACCAITYSACDTPEVNRINQELIESRKQAEIKSRSNRDQHSGQILASGDTRSNVENDNIISRSFGHHLSFLWACGKSLNAPMISSPDVWFLAFVFRVVPSNS